MAGTAATRLATAVTRVATAVTDRRRVGLAQEIPPKGGGGEVQSS